MKTFFRSDKGTLSMIRLLAFMVVTLGCIVCLSGIVFIFCALFLEAIDWAVYGMGMITTGGVSICVAVLSKAWQKKSEMNGGGNET